MAIETPPYYLLDLTVAGGSATASSGNGDPLAGHRPAITMPFSTVQEAMTAAGDYKNPAGAILLCAPGREPVEVIAYRADGTIEVGGGVAEDDKNWIDAPWTEAEIAENFRRSRELRAQRDGCGTAGADQFLLQERGP